MEVTLGGMLMSVQNEMADFEALFTLAIRHEMRLLADLTPGRPAAEKAGLPDRYCYFTARLGSAHHPLLIVPPGVPVEGKDLLEASARWVVLSPGEGPLLLMLPEGALEAATAMPDVSGHLQVFAYRIDPPMFRRLT